MMDPLWILLSWNQPFYTKFWLKLNSIWLKLIHSHSTWWCQASCILPSWIQAFWTNKNFTHSFSLNLRMTAILNSAIPGFSYFEQKKIFTHSFSLDLIMPAIFNSTILDSPILHKKLHSFILTHLDDGSHLEFYCLDSAILNKKNVSHSFWLNLVMAYHLEVHYVEFGHACFQTF